MDQRKQWRKEPHPYHAPSDVSKTITWQIGDDTMSPHVVPSLSKEDSSGVKAGILKKSSQRQRAESFPAKHGYSGSKGLRRDRGSIKGPQSRPRGERSQQTGPSADKTTGTDKLTSLKKRKSEAREHRDSPNEAAAGNKKRDGGRQGSKARSSKKLRTNKEDTDEAPKGGKHHGSKKKKQPAVQKGSVQGLTDEEFPSEKKPAKRVPLAQTKKFSSSEKQPPLGQPGAQGTTGAQGAQQNVYNNNNNFNSVNNVHYESEGEIEKSNLAGLHTIYSKKEESCSRGDILHDPQGGEGSLPYNGLISGTYNPSASFAKDSRNFTIGNAVSFQQEADKLTQITPRDQPVAHLNTGDGRIGGPEQEVPSVKDQYENGTNLVSRQQSQNSKTSTMVLTSQNSIEDQAALAGFAVFIGKDIFHRFESSQLPLRKPGHHQRDKPSILDRVFHSKQAPCKTKTDLIQAKRESRALRAAKLRQVKFEDAFCSKAVDLAEQKIMNELIGGTLTQMIPISPPTLRSSRKASQEPRLETPDHHQVSPLPQLTPLEQLFKDSIHKKQDSIVASQFKEPGLMDGLKDPATDRVNAPKSGPFKDSRTSQFSPEGHRFIQANAGMMYKQSRQSEHGSSVKEGGPQHEIMSGNSINMFVPMEKDLSIQQEVVLAGSQISQADHSPISVMEYGQPKGDSTPISAAGPGVDHSPKMRSTARRSKAKGKLFTRGQNDFIQKSMNARTFYHPKMFQLEQVKAAAIQACHAANLGIMFKKDFEIGTNLKSYLPSNVRDNIHQSNSQSRTKNQRGPVVNRLSKAQFKSSSSKSNQLQQFNKLAGTSSYGGMSSNLNSRKGKRLTSGAFPATAGDLQYHSFIDIKDIQKQIKHQVQKNSENEQRSIVSNDLLSSIQNRRDNIEIEAVDGSSVGQSGPMYNQNSLKKQNTQKFEGRGTIKHKSTSPDQREKDNSIRQSLSTTQDNLMVSVAATKVLQQKAQRSQKSLRGISRVMNNGLSTIGTGNYPAGDSRSILFSASKQKFTLHAPILKQSKFNKGNRAKKNSFANIYHRKYMADETGSQYWNPATDKNSEGPLNHQQQKYLELLSSFDLNEKQGQQIGSDIHQKSILAMSQSNIYTQSIGNVQDDHHSSLSQHNHGPAIVKQEKKRDMTASHNKRTHLFNQLAVSNVPTEKADSHNYFPRTKQIQLTNLAPSRKIKSSSKKQQQSVNSMSSKASKVSPISSITPAKEKKPNFQIKFQSREEVPNPPSHINTVQTAHKIEEIADLTEAAEKPLVKEKKGVKRSNTLDLQNKDQESNKPTQGESDLQGLPRQRPPQRNGGDLRKARRLKQGVSGITHPRNNQLLECSPPEIHTNQLPNCGNSEYTTQAPGQIGDHMSNNVASLNAGGGSTGYQSATNQHNRLPSRGHVSMYEQHLTHSSRRNFDIQGYAVRHKGPRVINRDIYSKNLASLKQKQQKSQHLNLRNGSSQELKDLSPGEISSSDKIHKMYPGINLPNMNKYQPMAKTTHDGGSMIAMSPQHQSMGKFQAGAGSPIKPGHLASSLTQYNMGEKPASSGQPQGTGLQESSSVQKLRHKIASNRIQNQAIAPAQTCKFSNQRSQEELPTYSNEATIPAGEDYNQYLKTNYISEFSGLQQNMFLGAHQQPTPGHNMSGINQQKLQKIARPYLMSAHNTSSNAYNFNLKAQHATVNRALKMTQAMANSMAAPSGMTGILLKAQGYSQVKPLALNSGSKAQPAREQQTMRYLATSEDPLAGQAMPRGANTLEVKELPARGREEDCSIANMTLNQYNFIQSPQNFAQRRSGV